MNTPACPRLAALSSAAVVIAAGLAAAPPAARAEADFRALPVAWLSATIAMPTSAILRQPEVSSQTRHAEAIAPAPARLVPIPAARGRVYPDAVILRALRHGDRSFARCWSRARRHDVVAPRKARLHLEVDAAGVVRSARTDGDGDAELGQSSLPNCLSRVGRRLPFPATGKPMRLSLLLLR